MAMVCVNPPLSASGKRIGLASLPGQSVPEPPESPVQSTLPPPSFRTPEQLDEPAPQKMELRAVTEALPSTSMLSP